MGPCSISRPKSACGQLSPSSSSKHRLYCYLRAFPLIEIDEAMRHVSWGLLVTSRPFHFVIWMMNQLKLVQGVGHPYLPCHRIFKSCKPGVEIWEQMRFFIRSWPEEALIRNKVQPVKFRWYEHWGGGGGREGEGGWSTERVRIYSVSEFRESVRAFFPQGQGKLFLLSVLSGYP